MLLSVLRPPKKGDDNDLQVVGLPDSTLDFLLLFGPFHPKWVDLEIDWARDKPITPKDITTPTRDNQGALLPHTGYSSLALPF